jgi:hypothetical protein
VKKIPIPKLLQPSEVMSPEEAAQAVRALIRNGHAEDEKDLILELCSVAVHSKNPGEAYSMELTASAVAAGRRIKRTVFTIEEMEQDDEEED